MGPCKVPWTCVNEMQSWSKEFRQVAGSPSPTFTIAALFPHPLKTAVADTFNIHSPRPVPSLIALFKISY